MINFEWIDDDSNVNVIVIVKWHHVDDESVQKYVLCLDNKEIHYVVLLIEFVNDSIQYLIGRSPIIFT